MNSIPALILVFLAESYLFFENVMVEKAILKSFLLTLKQLCNHNHYLQATLRNVNWGKLESSVLASQVILWFN